MPNQPKTPLRAIRVEDPLWDAARERCRTDGTTISDVIRKALREYVGENVQEAVASR